MTDRYNYLTVVLERNLRDDDAEGLINAIKMLRGVLEVKPNIANAADFLAETRARQDIGEKLWGVLYPKNKDV